MSQTAIVLPVCAQVLITFVVFFIMALRRRTAFNSGQTKIKDIALGQDAWPEPATKAARSFSNQFEIPVLFYAVTAFALITKSVDYVMLGLAWLFVVARAAQAFEHIGVNYVQRRAAFYFVSVLAVMAMWLLLFVRVALA